MSVVFFFRGSESVFPVLCSRYTCFVLAASRMIDVIPFQLVICEEESKVTRSNCLLMWQVQSDWRKLLFSCSNVELGSIWESFISKYCLYVKACIGTHLGNPLYVLICVL